jgi:competence protein ComEA
VVGLLLAIGGFALAALLAVGGLGGDVVVDGGTSLGSPAGSLTAGRGDLIVDVGGAVLRPGVYHLPAGARVSDAIAAAGGYSPRVAAEQASAQLNLAAPVHDGDQIVVPSRDDPGAGGSSPGSGGGSGGGGGGGGHLIDLNHASADELDTLPGIGPVTAAKIIAARNESPFTSVDQLLERKLVGQKVFDGLKPLVTV